MNRPAFGSKPPVNLSASASPESVEGVGAAGVSGVTVSSSATSDLSAEVARADDLAAQFLRATRAPAGVELNSEEGEVAGAASSASGELSAPGPGIVVRPSFQRNSNSRGGALNARYSKDAKPAESDSESGDPFALVPTKRTAVKEKEKAAPAASAPMPDAIPVDQAAFDLPSAPVYGESPGPFGKRGALSGPAVRALRADIKAASIVTDLVSAMAVHPGSDADVAVKSKLLTALLVSARKSAIDLIEMVDPERADVGWVKAQAISQTASMLAAEWTKDALSETEVRRRLDLRMTLVRSLLSDHGGAVEEVLADFAEGNHYKACTDAQSASDHRAVAIHQAAWVFSDAVCSVRDKSGAVYCFCLPEGDVVAALLQQTTSIVMASRPEIRDPEASVTWMRGALRRATRLVAAEYSNKARESCAARDAASDGHEKALHEKGAPAQFSDTVLPFIAHWGIRNFQAIERASRKLIEESQDEYESTDRPGH